MQYDMFTYFGNKYKNKKKELIIQIFSINE